MRRLLLGVAVLGLWVFVGVIAMADSPPPGGTPVNPDGTEYRTPNDKLADIGEQVPGFGGMYRDPADQDVLKVFMLDTTNGQQKTDVAGAITDKFPGTIRPGGIEVIQGQYSMSQLTDWYRQVITAIGSAGILGNGFVLTDLEEDKNRIEVGVTSEKGVAIIETMLAGLPDVPREAVRVTIRQKMQFRTGSGSNAYTGSQTVRDRIRPLIGGIQTQGSDQGICTIGFNVRRNSTYGVAVNSHCTEEFASTDYTVFYQEEEDDSDDQIGQETVDGDYVTCPFPHNLWNLDCRYADVAFVNLDSGVEKDMGHIARTTGVGSITISTSYPRYRVVSETSSGVSGDVLAMVGRSNGAMTPILDDVCVDYATDDGDVLLCQDVAISGGGLANGDSGAPVFRITNSPTYGDVTLYGIAWGSTGDEIGFSPMDQIQLSSELGSIRTCALEIGC